MIQKKAMERLSGTGSQMSTYRAEFLNVTVSPSCDGAKFLDLFVQARKFRIVSIYIYFLSMFKGLLTIFLCNVFKSKIVMAQKKSTIRMADI